MLFYGLFPKYYWKKWKKLKFLNPWQKTFKYTHYEIFEFCHSNEDHLPLNLDWCDKCIWFKWWGELHGYPDINPWSFREHLEPATHLWLNLSIEWFLSSIVVSVWQTVMTDKFIDIVKSRWYFVILYPWTMWL